MVWLWVWGIITATALVIEFLKSDLFFIWFAAGGLVTLLVEALIPTLAIIWQLAIFILVSFGLILFVRKPCVRMLNAKSDEDNTNKK